MDPEIYEIAKKKVNQKKKFYRHLSAFLAVGFFFFMMNMLTLDGDREMWFFFPMLPWSIGLFIHYFTTFGLPYNKALSAEWEQEEMLKEIDLLRRQREDNLLPPPDEKDYLPDLPELPKKEKIERTNWDDNDFV
ncbi:MAG: 2TM domain-containing protein [Bacteroidota bacterium]